LLYIAIYSCWFGPFFHDFPLGMWSSQLRFFRFIEVLGEARAWTMARGARPFYRRKRRVEIPMEISDIVGKSLGDVHIFGNWDMSLIRWMGLRNPNHQLKTMVNIPWFCLGFKHPLGDAGFRNHPLILSIWIVISLDDMNMLMVIQCYKWWLNWEI